MSETSIWRHYFQDEVDAAFLYSALAELTREEAERKTFRKLSEVEEKHAQRWRELMEQRGVKIGQGAPSLKARLMRWAARTFGPGFLKQVMLREEGLEVKVYLDLYQKSTREATRKLALDLAKDSARHAGQLGEESDPEPWHSVGAGGMLRNVVYGFNDGLTANFGLIAGVIGASTSDHIIIVTGLAGVIADALSMGSSGYLAAKSEREVFEYEKEMEAREILLMPEIEAEELALIYTTRGMEEEQARQLAAEVIADPDRALEEKVREELGISDSEISPMKEAWMTGIATAVGALIPIAPFLFLRGFPAIVLSFSASMLAHFAVGAVRSFFTGRSFWRSGFDMFIVGFGVAAVGYLLGELLLKYFL
ncbi:MAG: VIT1/CCC1 transporter family protein [Saprospiraceae bacterium]|nr:VIT1/CCC1 transporter family protein [Saprospiraceae bacterium]MCB0626082.1 VIT1/CCC1 transporter family protein [Saprospiraceae bacterium]MCB0676782.1 VIT1/CCC1 transporter family protein [Saprospiraceae bacterium]MCB0680280.1 VIT1/CCC1 transporter family protein [Saprospiraceae bacterium]